MRCSLIFFRVRCFIEFSVPANLFRSGRSTGAPRKDELRFGEKDIELKKQVSSINYKPVRRVRSVNAAVV